ncbi:MAG: DUF4258 domain-containing protein [Ferruginibacter sp.]
MKSKLLPILLLLAAAAFFFWIKMHQRGKGPGVTTTKAITAYTALREGNKTVVYSKHALCRMDCRHIDETEVKEILKEGTVNFNRIEETNKGVTYPVEGTTHDGQHVRIVFAPNENKLTVITVIDLEKEWSCDCS